MLPTRSVRDIGKGGVFSLFLGHGIKVQFTSKKIDGTGEALLLIFNANNIIY